MTLCCLTIAGSDPSGGAGIQADIKTFSALNSYAMSVITALTAQSTVGVDNVLPISPSFVSEQFLTLYRDIRIDSVKVGMLMNKAIAQQVSELLLTYPIPYVVLDTVMVAKGGQALLKDDAIDVIRTQLLPLATLITPNLPEAAALLGRTEAMSEAEMVEQGEALIGLGCQAVLMKGGHLTSQDSPDYLISRQGIIRYSAVRVQTKNTHGTGCTLSAAIAALLPQFELTEAVRRAKNYLYNAILHADELQIGQGIGPTHHFYHWHNKPDFLASLAHATSQAK